MGRWLRRGLLALLGLVIVLPLLLLGGAWLALNVRPGQEAIADLVNGMVPGVRIENLHGGLPASPRIGRLVLSDARGPYLIVEDIALDLDLMRLAARELRATRIAAGRILLERLPDPDPTAAPAEPGPILPQLPQLPIQVAAEAIALPRIEIGAAVAGFPAVLAAEGGGRLGADGAFFGLKVRRQDAPGALDLDLALAPGDRVRIALGYDEPRGGLAAGLLGDAEQATRLRLSLDGPASGAAFTLDAEMTGKARIGARGTLRLPAGGGVGLEAEGETALGGFLPAPLADARFSLRTVASGGATHVERARLEAGPLALEASGRIAEALDLTFNATSAESAALAGLVPEMVGWERLEARGTVAGPTSAPVLTVDATIGSPRLPAPAPALLGPAPRIRLRADTARVHTLDVEGRAVTLHAEGAYSGTLDLTLTAELAAQDVPDLPVRGRLSARARVTGAPAEPAVALSVETPALTAYGRTVEALRLDAELPRATVPAGRLTAAGRLQGLGLSAEVRAAAEGSLIRLETLRATLGPARLEARGEVNTGTTRATLDLRLNAPDLAPLSGLAGVPLAGAVRLEGRLAPQGERQGVDVTLSANNARAAGTVVNGTVAAQGTDAALDVRADLRALDGRLTTRARVALDGPDKRAEIAALEVVRQNLGLRLTGPGTVVLGADGGVSTPGLNFAGRPGGTLRVAGRWGPANADLRAGLSALPLSVVNLFVPDPPLSGTLSGEVHVTGAVARPAIEGEIRGTGLRAGAPWARGLPEGTLRATARMRGDQLGVDADFRVGSGATLNLEARLPADGAGPISGTLRGTTDLGVLAGPFLLGGANRVAGTVAINAQATGTVAAPRVSGTARLSGGIFRNLEYGIALREITASARGDMDRVVLESLTARAGTGTLTVRGEARPFTDTQPIDLTITGRDLQPVSSDLLRGSFSTDLRLSGSLGAGMRATGRIATETATIGIPERLPGGVADLGTVREVGRGAPPPAPGTAQSRRTAGRQARNAPPPRPDAPPLALDIAFEAPSRFYLRGRGLDVELGGAIRVAGTVSEPQAVGDLRLRRGTLTVLDRRLTFSRGLLRFTGDALSPDIDLLATSRATNTTINVIVSGTPRDPKIEFTSSPELPQDEVLARLIFNRATSNLSPFQIAQLARVLSGAVSGGQEDPVTGFVGRISRSLGLDRLGIGTGANGAPGLEAGGYLGQGIYLNVDPGTSTGSPRVGVQVELTPRLRLESNAGTDSQGVGLSYEYEY
ncbi:translocation/assembly module TamB domain-containing protein [Muricoccus radiodurans]|uniref:translocation/assembly module TamB domain-containing protein n=1 Tax=Muricoccus radiodurans TaxID=2231721 RepID=UPI003CE6D74E